MAAAFISRARFSCSERTTPFKVTLPSTETIFILWAYVDNPLSAMTLLRMRFVKSISFDLFVCASAVAAEFEWSAWLLFVLSGGVSAAEEGERAPFAFDCALAG